MKYRVKKVDSNYGIGFSSYFYSDSPTDRWIVQEYNGWFWGWHQCIYKLFLFESDAKMAMSELTNHTA